jgi:hypothetical protein
MSFNLETSLRDLSSGLVDFKSRFGSRLDAIQTQVDALDHRQQTRHVAGGGTPDGLMALGEKLLETKADFDRYKRISFEVPTLLPQGKSLILSTNLTSTEPASGVQGAGRFPYRLRRLFRTVPTSLPTIGVLRSVTEALSPSPQNEGDEKSQSTLTFALAQVPVQTLATFVNFTRQALDDLDGFQEFIRSTLVWALEGRAELEILSGDGTGVHLPGLATFAEDFDASILSDYAGWNLCDILGAAAVQLAESGWSPDFAVISPRSYFKMRSSKTLTAEYLLASPVTSPGKRVYDLEIIPSPKISDSVFLVGDSNQAVIRQRAETTVELSYEHGVNFTSNLVTCLAETRFGVQCLRPDAFVTGTLAASPASA